MPLALQESFIEETPRIKSIKIIGGRAPFLSYPDFIVEAIVKAAYAA